MRTKTMLRKKSLTAIKKRVQSPRGYSQMNAGVHGFDVSSMADDLRTLLARTEQAEKLLDAVLDWALANRNTDSEFVRCYTYHKNYPLTLALVKEYLGESVRKDFKLINDAQERRKQDEAAVRRFAEYRAGKTA